MPILCGIFEALAIVGAFFTSFAGQWQPAIIFWLAAIYFQNGRKL